MFGQPRVQRQAALECPASWGNVCQACHQSFQRSLSPDDLDGQTDRSRVVA